MGADRNILDFILMRVQLFLIFALILGISCNDNEPVYRRCNSLLSNCEGNPNGAFCTFGYKWGNDNPFPNAGLEKDGPESSGGTITFGFYEEGEPINTHRHENIQTVSFKRITVCEPKDQIRIALTTWSSHTNLEFEEISDSEIADIKFAVADINLAVGYPPYEDDLCSLLGGFVIFGLPGRGTCDGFQNLALHEIGHTLGLGHVSSSNIMNIDYYLPELGNGDVLGIQSIYGTK